MEKMIELPDSHIVSHALQFLDTALLLMKAAPKVVAPSPIRVNAAFAIELFIKSLDAHWQRHPIDEGEELDVASAITSKANSRKHELPALFNSVPDSIRSEIAAAFASRPLSGKYSTIEDVLTVYAKTFEIERYVFEQLSTAYDSRPLQEIVDLAKFFSDYVHSRPRRRYLTEEKAPSKT